MEYLENVIYEFEHLVIAIEMDEDDELKELINEKGIKGKTPFDKALNLLKACVKR